MGLLLRIRRKHITTGTETFPGKVAVVSDDFVDGRGRVQLNGALWSATSDDNSSPQRGDKVTVVDIQGLKLKITSHKRPEN